MNYAQEVSDQKIENDSITFNRLKSKYEELGLNQQKEIIDANFYDMSKLPKWVQENTSRVFSKKDLLSICKLYRLYCKPIKTFKGFIPEFVVDTMMNCSELFKNKKLNWFIIAYPSSFEITDNKDPVLLLQDPYNSNFFILLKGATWGNSFSKNRIYISNIAIGCYFTFAFVSAMIFQYFLLSSSPITLCEPCIILFSFIITLLEFFIIGSLSIPHILANHHNNFLK